jgi:dipeptidyl aminopeptidase/acylaminoacyl peptidase
MLVGPANHRATALVVISAAGVMETELEPWPLNFTWSPDGRAIAVVSASETGSSLPARVWIVPHDGSAPREMRFDCESCIEAQGGTLGWATDAVWSPDSRQVALGFNPADGPEAIGEFTENPRYWVGSVESGRLAEVTGVPGLDLFGWHDDDSLLMGDRTHANRWFAVPVEHPEDAVAASPPATTAGLSPDGKYRLGDSYDSELAVTEVDGGGRRVLVREPGISYLAWNWAPDSQSIVFTKYSDATGNPLDGIWVVNLDGDVRLLNADYKFAGSWQSARE